MTLASNVCRSDCEDFAEVKLDSSEDVKVVQGWDSMGLRAELLRGINACGYEEPTKIQQQSIKPIIEGRDVVAQAQSGTGKTVAFCIAVLQKIDTAVLETQAICLSPSRGLAIQIQKTITPLADFLDIDCHACIGGTHLGEDIRKLDYGQHIISGTPGRTFDMIRRGFLQTRSIKMLVVDEADEMFNKGFREQLYNIKSYLPSNTQFVFISTTIPQEIHEMTTKFMTNPMQILIKDDGLTLDGFKQFFVAVVQEEGKFETLCDMYDILSIVQTIVFCNTKKMANMLTEKLGDAGFTASCIHSDMSQKEQDSNLKIFRSGGSRVLISTDGSARGIDIPSVSIVINYDLPKNRELYIRRIGRSSRFGKKGVAVNFVKSNEIEILRDIEQHYSTEICEMPANFADFI